MALALVLHELAYVHSVTVLQLSIAVLHALIPVTIVEAAFCESHSPFAVSMIIFGLAQVDVSICSNRSSMAILLVVRPVTLVEFASALESDASSVAVCPLVLSLAHILGLGLIVAPMSVLLDHVDSLRCVRFELLVFIFAKSIVSLSDDLSQAVVDALIHAPEDVAFVPVPSGWLIVAVVPMIAPVLLHVRWCFCSPDVQVNVISLICGYLGKLGFELILPS